MENDDEQSFGKDYQDDSICYGQYPSVSSFSASFTLEEERLRLEETTRLEQHKIWMKVLDNHKKTWISLGANADIKSKTDSLSLLDNQLTCYFSYPACKDTECFISGTGYCTAKVIFLARDPTPFEIKQQSAFQGRASEFLIKKIKTILRQEESYFMYVFPYHIGKERNPDQFEEELFLPYALRRISIIKPTLIVVLGQKPYKYAGAGFDFTRLLGVKSYTELRHDQLKGKDTIAQVRMDDRDVGVLLCPHPFQICNNTESNSTTSSVSHQSHDERSNFNRNAYNYWNQCFSQIDVVINGKKIRGPKVVAESGDVVLDSIAVMKKSSIEYYSDPFRLEKRRQAKKRRFKNSYCFCTISTY